MTLLARLAYGDLHVLLNTLRELRKHPGRMVLWGFYVLGIASFALLKLVTPARPAAPTGLTLATVDFWVCGFAIAFGVVLATGTARTLGAFSSRAEALLMLRADAPPIAVAAYLQLRAVVVVLGQGIGRFAYLIVFALPAGTTWQGLIAELSFFATCGVAIASVALPRALSRGAARIAAIAAGSAIAIAAAEPVALDAAHWLRLPGTDALLHRLPALHPGLVLSSIAGGDLRIFVVPLVVAALATTAFVLAARDAFPELYAISLASLDRLSRRTRRSAGVSAAASGPSRVARVRSSFGTAFTGALAFVWADALTFSRRVAPAITALAAASALAAGAAFAVFAQHGGELATGVVFGTLPGLYVALASTTGLRLAPVMRMPLFWLGPVPLAARLGAWLFGPLARDATLVVLAVAGFVAVSHAVRAPLIVLVGALALLTLTRSVGLAVFAVMPNALDQRGPAVLIRTLAAFMLLIPPLFAGAIAAFALPAPFFSVTLAAALTALAEATLLVVFAASRLAGSIDRLSLA